MSEEIGNVKYTVEADISGIKEGISDAKAEVESLGDSTESVEKSVSGSFSKIGESIESSTAGLRKFVGAIGSTLGIVTGLAAAVGFAVSVFQKLKTKMDELATPQTGSIDSLNTRLEELVRILSGASVAADRFPIVVKLEEDLKNATERIDEIRADLAYLDDAIVPTITGAINRRKLTEELDELQEISLSARKQLDEFRGQARELLSTESIELETQKAEKFIKTLEGIVLDQEISILPADEQIKANADKQKSALIAAAKEANVQIEDEKLQLVLKNIDEAAKRQVMKNEEVERKKQEERERRDKESAEKAAKAQADALERALAPVIAGLTSSFGTGFTTQLNRITTEIQTATDEIRKVKRGR